MPELSEDGTLIVNIESTLLPAETSKPLALNENAELGMVSDPPVKSDTSIKTLLSPA